MKKRIGLIFICLIVFLIYYFTKDNKVYYVSIGDYVSMNHKIDNFYGKRLEKSVYYHNENYFIDDLIDDIDSNKVIKCKNKEYSIINLFIKSDVIVISIGMNDLLFYDEMNDNMYTYIDEVLYNVDKLLEKVRYYSKEKIYIYNYFGFNKSFLAYINERLDIIAKDYNVGVIDISKIKSRRKLDDVDYKYIEKQLLGVK